MRCTRDGEPASASKLDCHYSSGSGDLSDTPSHHCVQALVASKACKLDLAAQSRTARADRERSPSLCGRLRASQLSRSAASQLTRGTLRNRRPCRSSRRSGLVGERARRVRRPSEHPRYRLCRRRGDPTTVTQTIILSRCRSSTDRTRPASRCSLLDAF